MKKHVKFDENFNLIAQEINSKTTIEVVKSVNHIIIIDVSGSMSWDLPEIRKNLKNKISNLIKGEDDTISIIWFSGRNDAGILKEEIHVNSLKQLNDLNDAIDKYLKPVGLTAFTKPLELANDIIERISKNNQDGLFSLIFMTDGYSNNDISWNNVRNAVKEISPKLSSSLVVEYGHYCDTRKLIEISELLGGEKIDCTGFEEYDIVIAKGFTKKLSGGKKVVVEITDKHLFDFAFSIDNDGSVLVYNITDNKIMVGDNVNEIHFFSDNAIGDENNHQHTALYAAIYLLSERFMSDEAEKVFYSLGDNHYYKMLSNAFGKQKLNEFKTAIKECVADVSKRFPDGIAKIQPVSDNAYCLMNLIEDLGNIDNCLFYPNHPDFTYNRIGRKKIAVGSTLTDADKQRLNEAKNIDEASTILKELEEKKVDIKFINSNPDRGYSLTDLVWNDSRSNLSVRIYIEGEAILPKNNFNIEKVASFKYNTFTLIKDGIVNVEKLPVNYSLELISLLKANGVKYEIYTAKDNFDNTVVIDLSSLPIINRGMVKSISANDLANKEWNLIKLQGDKKVYDYYKKSLFPKTSKSFTELLGQEAADWLKEIGITDFNGFAPKVTSAEATDFYMSVNLTTKIKGLSSLPKVEDVVAKIKDKKPLKLNEWIMSDAIIKYNSQLESDMYKSLSAEQQLGVLKTYLETKSAMLNKKRRKVLQEIAEIKFALILSKRNFIEFKTFDENTLNIKLDDQELTFTFEFSEKEEKI